MKGPRVFSIEVTDFAIVTYAVPAERVWAHLPKPYELDTFEGPKGTIAFVSTTCFCNRDFRPTINYPRHTFNESTYRTYVTHKGRKGIYFFGRYLSTTRAWVSQRPIARHTYRAAFDVSITNTVEGYASYLCKVVSDVGDTSFSLQAMQDPEGKHPFTSGEELAQFLTYRLHGFYTDVIGAQGHMPVSHPRMNPFAGELSDARFDLWDKLEILRPEEARDPYSVLVVPAVPFKLFAPRFLV
ncbi:MAG: DUF2071 domain-containing protein [Actinomycetota bacterium]